MDKVRILLLDDHALFRESLARLLAAEPDFEVVQACSSVDEALRVMATAAVDLVLLDLDLDGERGSGFVRRAKERGPLGKVLIVTAGSDELEATQLIAAGASGVFLKHSPLALLKESIRKVMGGETWIDARYVRTLVGGRTPVESGSPPKLSSRERAVLMGVLEGMLNKEIAERMNISESSVKAALQQLFEKTGVRTRTQLARIALQEYGGLLKSQPLFAARHPTSSW